MVVVPLSKAGDGSELEPRSSCGDSTPWIRYAAAGTLAASGALLATGNRRSGLVTALTGAVLAMIDQQEVVAACWNALPGYLEEVQADAWPRADRSDRFVGAGREAPPGAEQVVAGRQFRRGAARKTNAGPSTRFGARCAKIRSG